jgi:hypothetical protein
MTFRNPECRVQVHAPRMSARKGTHSQVRALALRDTAQPAATLRKQSGGGVPWLRT